MIILIAIVATLLATAQNTTMIAFGMKELAIFSFPLSFIGIFLAEIVLIWAGVFISRKFASRKLFYAVWVLAVLIIAEAVLPVSTFTMYLGHMKRQNVLDQILLTKTDYEILASDHPGSRFAITYTLEFPGQGHYLTFPAYIDDKAHPNIFGHYFMKMTPEYYDETYVFEPGKPYKFTVLFDTGADKVDFAAKKAKIDICDGKDYFMTCRIIPIDLMGITAALAANPNPVAREPATPDDNFYSLAEKSIRLDALKVAKGKAGEPVDFTFVITNAGKKEIALPNGHWDGLIHIVYAWEPLDEAAKKTKIMQGIGRIGNSVMAGGTQFTFMPKDKIAPGDFVPVKDQIKPFEPFAAGEYKLHVLLFDNYAVEEDKPVQELTQDFTITP